MNLRFESTPVAPLPRVDAGTLLRTRAFAPDPDLRAACLAHGAATEQLDRLFTADALCVTTGQQPGLLTGPLLTIYKAVSAIALARRFEEILGRPVVPVFWVAGDDHDYAEANH
ncbi:MAG: bacillithiol biosynthesis BshC, partial [Gemmatimonadales bacterium]